MAVIHSSLVTHIPLNLQYKGTETQNLNVSRFGLQLSLRNILKPGVKNEDVVVAAPTGDAPTPTE